MPRKDIRGQVPELPCVAQVIEVREALVRGQRVTVKVYGKPRWKTPKEIAAESTPLTRRRRRRHSLAGSDGEDPDSEG